MKISLPIKLGIFIVVLFGLLLGGLLLWTPVRVRYYTGKLNSADDKKRVEGVDGLIATGPAGRDTLARNLAGGEPAADFLITHWANPNEVIAQDEYGCYPLHYAAAKGYPTVATLLIAKGAEVDAKDNGNVTPLHLAAASDHKTVAELLITKGAVVDAKDDDDWTPLHYAAVSDHKAVAELLIAKGAEINAKDWSSRTPLHRAAQGSHKTVTELLIAKGAVINLKDQWGQTPLDCAIERGKNEVAALICKHSGKTGKEIKEQENKEIK